ncbi:MAG: DUF4352 domain-containing protein [Trichococcus flocculiformis]|uniref:DUF4352 domain-containing protein n=1 Tax=Trichococcus flocculiformis TaxID=82803 RepID=A0A847D524_9LACT|nr:DUF4352 domain-containing protein [Trichococcus flocculiformis]NLD31929.1 DUF4352 domain-containing protein [Trichococcus flocculiformis]
MKKYTVLVALTALILASIACGGTSSEPQVNPPSGDTEVIQPEVVEGPAVGTARSNPAPVGSEVVADKMVFTVTSIVRPANDIVMAGNQFNTKTEENQEYIFVELNVICKKSSDEKCSINPTFNMKLIGSNGIEYDPDIFLAGVKGLLETTEFYGDASVKGYIPFIVGVGETDLVLLYDPFLGDTFYLALP